MESSPAFAVLPLSDSSLLGLWQRDMVQPAMDEQATVGMTELAIPVASNSLVDAMYAQWGAQGVTLVQAPTQLPFGYTFTAQDSDGHRLRIWCPSADVRAKADAGQ